MKTVIVFLAFVGCAVAQYFPPSGGSSGTVTLGGQVTGASNANTIAAIDGGVVAAAQLCLGEGTSGSTFTCATGQGDFMGQTGYTIVFLPNSNCNLNATLNVDAQGAAGIYQPGGLVAVSNADCLAGGSYTLVYDPNGFWEMQAPPAASLNLGSAAKQNTGTSGANVPLLNGNLTFSGSNAYGTPASINLTNATATPACATCVTSAASLPSGALVIGGGSQATSATSANASLSTGALTLGSSGVAGSITLNGATSGSMAITESATGGSTKFGSNISMSAAGSIGMTGNISMTESAAPAGFASTDLIWGDSTAHTLKAEVNGSSTPGTIVMSLPGAIRSTGLTAAVTTATLCANSAGACNQSGMYHVHVALYQSGSACSANTTNGVAPNITWTDGNGTTHSTVGFNLAVPNTSLVATSGTMPWGATTVNGIASGDMNIDSNGTGINYAITFAQCSTGTATYAASLAVTRLQ